MADAAATAGQAASLNRRALPLFLTGTITLMLSAFFVFVVQQLN
jgi:hypothetical protein